jgi:hypothetical protein
VQISHISQNMENIYYGPNISTKCTFHPPISQEVALSSQTKVQFIVEIEPEGFIFGTRRHRIRPCENSQQHSPHIITGLQFEHTFDESILSSASTGFAVVRSPTEAKNFSSNLGSGAHPDSCTMGTGGSFPRVKRGRGVMLTTYPLLVPRVRKNRSCNCSPPQAPAWCVTGPLLYFCAHSTHPIATRSIGT